MTLQQLRFLVAVAQNDLNITVAGARLSATQPALSRQLKLLEEELGFDLFVRNGRSIAKVTPLGERVLLHARRILQEAQDIRGVSDDSRDANRGVLSIGTTHTQGRYVLPVIIKRFREQYPDVQVHLHQGTTEQIAEMAQLGRIDLAMASGSRELFGGYFLLPCYQWHRRVVVPKGHPLTQIQRPRLAQLAAHPLITYVFNMSGPASLYEIFAKEKLHPNVVLTAQDSDVIKTYVRLGLGIGIIADVALEQGDGESLTSIEVAHLFPAHTAWIGFRRGSLLVRYTYDFLQLLAPHLTRRLLARANDWSTQKEVDELFERVQIPVHGIPAGTVGNYKTS